MSISLGFRHRRHFQFDFVKTRSVIALQTNLTDCTRTSILFFFIKIQSALCHRNTISVCVPVTPESQNCRTRRRYCFEATTEELLGLISVAVRVITDTQYVVKRKLWEPSYSTSELWSESSNRRTVGPDICSGSCYNRYLVCSKEEALGAFIPHQWAVAWSLQSRHTAECSTESEPILVVTGRAAYCQSVSQKHAIIRICSCKDPL
jgi:hypothetical protein